MHHVFISSSSLLFPLLFSSHLSLQGNISAVILPPRAPTATTEAAGAGLDETPATTTVVVPPVVDITEPPPPPPTKPPTTTTTTTAAPAAETTTQFDLDAPPEQARQVGVNPRMRANNVVENKGVETAGVIGPLVIIAAIVLIALVAAVISAVMKSSRYAANTGGSATSVFAPEEQPLNDVPAPRSAQVEW